ncbi:hypothetical protein HBI25_161250 [Parastagonospora nodorum]|nr:hypothetical protein HBH43_171610 [Parastagonospora nodorum]KAH4235560.1 hypothetical protein HBI05_149860 [Parastagonospora nodorum]KAH4805804.1 hypothetical protein HBH61_157360 [Parastagonospora nodorum]KAH5554470.1 hypothetical protein HBI25_161250 [Parastagonospora nodorum]KAH5563720.1 hypothetical protein HBI26_180050 [Parastagonospora nodorum]
MHAMAHGLLPTPPRAHLHAQPNQHSLRAPSVFGSCGVHLLAWLMHIIRDRCAVCDGHVQPGGLFADIIRQKRAPTWPTAIVPKEALPTYSTGLHRNIFALAAVAPRQLVDANSDNPQSGEVFYIVIEGVCSRSLITIR